MSFQLPTLPAPSVAVTDNSPDVADYSGIQVRVDSETMDAGVDTTTQMGAGVSSAASSPTNIGFDDE